jgi:membrane protein YdbS with pleckstrin-like domain
MTEVLHFRPNRKVLYARCVAALVFALFPAIAVTIPLFITNAPPLAIVAAAAFAYSLIAGLRIVFLVIHFDTIRYELAELNLTNSAGRFWKVRRSTPLEKVTNVDVRQGPLDRYLGVGNIWVFTPSTGALTPEAMLVGIDHPYEIRARIVELAERARAQPATAGDAAAIPPRDGNERVLEEILRTLQRIEGTLGQIRKP